ncbi:hypothetical protein Mic7113_6733 (plasmid) [Allocoleopsis franciscana PCC 7113]|uniref:Uncharacterized protein n=1 Tax=Allocoleopsis franciscana PCC 7113 TaxID=1173027 RepID=K9WPG9_9CYAN|nr:hypothetical protein Mic7113_6733 [Allocoleopsis franciscana PCC 7113]
MGGSVSEFTEANLPKLIERGVPPKLAEEAVNILDAQNEGILPVPLEGEELNIVQSAWQWMTAQDLRSQPKD